MKIFSKLRRQNWFWILFSLSCLVSGCQQTGFQTQSSKGLVDFGKSIERAYDRLSKGQIRKKPGFYNECSLDFSTEKGIRVSQSICDDGKDALNVTIRVTDPATRPPSQKQDRVSISLAKLGITSLIPGETEKFSNGTTIKINRTGQSAILTRRLLVSR